MEELNWKQQTVWKVRQLIVLDAFLQFRKKYVIRFILLATRTALLFKQTHDWLAV